MTAPVSSNERRSYSNGADLSAPPRDRIAQLLRISDPPWLSPAVAAWLADPDAPPLHTALGIDRASYCRAVRDYHLCAAWRVTAPGLLPWPRAMDLAGSIRMFGSRVWPRAGALAAPPADWSAQRCALWHAFRAAGAVGVPESPDMIKKIVESAGLWIPQNACNDGPRRNSQGSAAP